jgi:hypothetical protein
MGGKFMQFHLDCNFEELETTFYKKYRTIEYIYMNIMVIK